MLVARVSRRGGLGMSESDGWEGWWVCRWWGAMKVKVGVAASIEFGGSGTEYEVVLREFVYQRQVTSRM